jgi:hypothetical protein
VRRLGGAACLLALGALAGCEYPLGPPPVTASFITPNYFIVAIAGEESAVVPPLRQRFYAAAEQFARSSGCTFYRVLSQTFLTSANVDPRMSVQPSWVFGRQPVYVGMVECGLPSPHAVAQRTPDRP